MRRALTTLFAATALIGTGALAQEADDAKARTEAIVLEWAQSAHADITAEAFTHWNDEGEVPPACAICHAGSGFRAFHGLDGSTPGEVPAQPVGGVIDCDTCHVEGAMSIAEVAFPSGVMISAPMGNGTCFTCHQGRQSGPGVAAKVEGMDPDTVNAELSFQNPHYKAAAATMHGADGMGMFEYPGMEYAGLYLHAPEPLCTSCHSPHKLEVEAELCAACHRDQEFEAIRVNRPDNDGDGDTSEGVAGEVATLQAMLADAITAYAANTAGTPVIYAESYPYFFTDTDGDGEIDEGEAAYPNRYASWTPRMLQAAYNYQFVAKDPGAYAHNPDYVLQVLLDTLEDLGAAPDGAVRP